MMLGRRGFLAGAAGVASVGAARGAWADQPLDDSGRIIPTSERNPDPYSGVSGPGLPVQPDDARGGWVSGLASVCYSGRRSMPYPVLPWGEAATAPIT